MILWAALGIVQFVIPPEQVFDYLNGAALAAGIITIVSYFPAVIDAWRDKRIGISPAHLLAFGIMANWIGFELRVGRWIISNGSPVNSLAIYNVGLWISITGAALLIGALATTPPAWTPLRIALHSAAFVALTGFFWFAGQINV
jgi:hypothetical protein